MGTKVNPTGFRLGQTKNWNSNWRTNKNDFCDKLHLDLQLKELIEVTLNNESILTGRLVFHYNCMHANHLKPIDIGGIRFHIVC